MSAKPWQPQGQRQQAKAEVPESANQKLEAWCDRLLRDMSDARSLSLKLGGLACCGELKTQLFSSAAAMEQLYTELASMRRADGTTMESLAEPLVRGTKLVMEYRTLQKLGAGMLKSLEPKKRKKLAAQSAGRQVRNLPCYAGASCSCCG